MQAGRRTPSSTGRTKGRSCPLRWPQNWRQQACSCPLFRESSLASVGVCFEFPSLASVGVCFEFPSLASVGVCFEFPSLASVGVCFEFPSLASLGLCVSLSRPSNIRYLASIALMCACVCERAVSATCARERGCECTSCLRAFEQGSYQQRLERRRRERKDGEEGGREGGRAGGSPTARGGEGEEEEGGKAGRVKRRREARRGGSPPTATKASRRRHNIPLCHTHPPTLHTHTRARARKHTRNFPPTKLASSQGAAAQAGTCFLLLLWWSGSVCAWLVLKAVLCSISYTYTNTGKRADRVCGLTFGRVQPWSRAIMHVIPTHFSNILSRESTRSIHTVAGTLRHVPLECIHLRG
jgi:hypothetical protein